MELFRQNLKRIRGSLANQTQVTSVHFGLPVSEPELLELIFDCDIRLLLHIWILEESSATLRDLEVRLQTGKFVL